VSDVPEATAAPAPGAGARLKERLKQGAHVAVTPLVSLLAAFGVRPDHVTIAGFVLSALSGLAFFLGRPVTGALVLLLAGLCDVLDGELARRSTIVSSFGAFLDSTLDRLSEAVVLLGLAAFYATGLIGSRDAVVQVVDKLARFELDPVSALVVAHNPKVWPLTYVVVTMVSVLALIGSFMVSYTRARAEGLGLDCKVGWFERPERMALLIVGGLATGVTRVYFPMPLALLLLAILSLVTAGQRMVHVYRITRGAGMDQPGGPSDG
jgi:CDP-diacylglycerol---glycerol-3-phosphate 3-phosphatidyltransferase